MMFSVGPNYHRPDNMNYTFPLKFRENPFFEDINRPGRVILELGTRQGVNRKWITSNTALKYYGYEPERSAYERTQSLFQDEMFYSLDQIPKTLKFNVILARNFFDSLLDNANFETLDFLTNFLISRSSPDCIWIFLESESLDKFWIDEWTIRFKIYPQIYLPVWNVPGRCSVDQLCLGTVSTLLINQWRNHES
jgi:hypothetical protein